MKCNVKVLNGFLIPIISLNQESRGIEITAKKQQSKPILPFKTCLGKNYIHLSGKFKISILKE